MLSEPKWVGWARELQAIAQTGLHFTESDYDRERYRRVLEISIEIFANFSGESSALIRGVFNNQAGYATPKVDVRGVVFRHDKLLLVLSKHSVESAWVEHEIERGLAKELRTRREVLFPVRLDDAVMSAKTSWAREIREDRNIGDMRQWKNHDAYKTSFERVLYESLRVGRTSSRRTTAGAS